MSYPFDILKNEIQLMMILTVCSIEGLLLLEITKWSMKQKEGLLASLLIPNEDITLLCVSSTTAF